MIQAASMMILMFVVGDATSMWDVGVIERAETQTFTDCF